MNLRLPAILLLLCALSGCGRPNMTASATIAIDFKVPESVKVQSLANGDRPVSETDFDDMRSFLQSGDFRSRLRYYSKVDTLHFSEFLETVTPTAPFTITIRSTTQPELDALVAVLPGVIRDYARESHSTLDEPITKPQ